jgi:hypothetical protein
MQTIYPGALWRPLSDVQTEPGIVPRQLIWHTMVGYLGSTENMFRKDGYWGTESTFGVGGKYDGALDGVVYQWQSLDHQADAQFDANAWANSIENSDGGHWTEPFTEKQVEAHIRLGVWWCHQTGVAPVKAPAWNAPGFGYHAMFHEWNLEAHSCPGPARASQLENEIWPEIAHVLNTRPKPPPQPKFPPFPLRAGWYFGPRNGPLESVSGYFGHRADLATWQRQMKVRGWSIETDGLYGPNTAKVASQFQKEKRLTVDGKIGKQTWDTAWLARVS